MYFLFITAILILLILCILLSVFLKGSKAKCAELEADNKSLKDGLQKNREQSEQRIAELGKSTELASNAMEYRIRQMENVIEQERRARHDYRHEQLLLYDYAKNGNREALSEILPKVESFSSSGWKPVCENRLADTLFRYYFHLAKQENITIDAAIEADNAINAEETDFVILLGNLLENAFTAAKEASSPDRFIRIRTMQTAGYFVFTSGNGYGSLRIPDDEGGFASTKNEHKGLGLKSIREIAEKYDGTARFYIDNKVFRSDVILFL